MFILPTDEIRMMTESTRQRGAARCEACGKALAVWVTSTHKIAPIGSVDGCPCGGSSFRLLG
ncbi:hypothetical protein C481_19030 [Natrialba asiatica DSM 12278]|uniref:Uncharacterized protein n=2 Tax=Natrialba asiatica TaxID=64602 RepID=M0AHB2_NATA1|nr:hypothetical protein C481_19030 [Natrialba asiatica DSM 12278]